MAVPEGQTVPSFLKHFQSGLKLQRRTQQGPGYRRRRRFFKEAVRGWGMMGRSPMRASKALSAPPIRLERPCGPSGAPPSASICMEMRGNHANACSLAPKSTNCTLSPAPRAQPSTHPSSDLCPPPPTHLPTSHPPQLLHLHSLLTWNRCDVNYALKYT